MRFGRHEPRRNGSRVDHAGRRSGLEGGVEDDVLAKRVDARAIQLDKDPGGKDTATERYNATAGLVQGWFCAEV